MNYLITVVKDLESYKRRYGANKALRGFERLQADCADDAPVAERLNVCLDTCLSIYRNGVQNAAPDKSHSSQPEIQEHNQDGWLILSPDNLEFNSAPSLKGLSPESVYGIFGSRVVTNLRKKKFIEYTGRLVTAHHYVQPHNPFQEFLHTYGGDFHEGQEVEILGFQCLVVHLSLLERHKLRFDSNLKSSCIAEDFCRQATGCGVVSRVISQPCVLHVDFQPPAQADEKARLDYDYYCRKYCQDVEAMRQAKNIPPYLADPLLPLPESVTAAAGGVILPEEKGWSARVGIYHNRINKDNFNHVAVLSADLMRPGCKLLDIGASFGDNGKFFQERLQARLWGLEYDKFSLDYAATQGIYTELFHENLESMALADYASYYRFFTHIFIGDVLEHLREPKAALIKLAELLEPGGSFVVSLPNVGHAYVSLNLLEGEFEYSANGILDATHLRFFTAQGQARLYAECGLSVKQATATFMIPGEYKNWGIGFDLPESVYDYVLSDRHALCMQYICELEKAGLEDESGKAIDTAALYAHNREVLALAPENNPRGWGQKQASYETLGRLIRENKQRQAVE